MKLDPMKELSMAAKNTASSSGSIIHMPLIGNIRMLLVMTGTIPILAVTSYCMGPIGGNPIHSFYQMPRNM